jgi:hypothetical protein
MSNVSSFFCDTEKLYTQQWSRIDGVGALIITPTRELAYQVTFLNVRNRVSDPLCGSRSSICFKLRIQTRIQFRIHGFDDRNRKKNVSQIPISLSQGLRPSLRTAKLHEKPSSTSKHKISLLCYIFVRHFYPPGSGSSNSNQCVSES